MDWKLSGKSRGRLRERMQTTVDARECRRCGALLRLNEGRAVSAAAREFGVSHQTLHNWRDNLRAAPEGELRDRQRGGRPTVWNKERVRMLKQLLAESPHQHGFYAVGWTAGLLQARLEQLLEWCVSEDSLRRKLHQLDYVWKRYRYRLKPDPLREKKKMHPQPCSRLAARNGGPVSGRNRPDAVPAVVIGLDEKGATG